MDNNISSFQLKSLSSEVKSPPSASAKAKLRNFWTPNFQSVTSDFHLIHTGLQYSQFWGNLPRNIPERHESVVNFPQKAAHLKRSVLVPARRTVYAETHELSRQIRDSKYVVERI